MATSNHTVPSHQITDDARNVLDRNLERLRAMMLAPVMSAGKDDSVGLCGAALIAYFDGALQFVGDCQRALEASDAQKLGDTPRISAVAPAPAGAPERQFSNPVTLEREYLEMINNSLLVGLLSYSELLRVKRELDATLLPEVKEYADGVRIITPDEDEAGRFATAIHLTAQTLEAVRLS